MSCASRAAATSSRKKSGLPPERSANVGRLVRQERGVACRQLDELGRLGLAQGLETQTGCDASAGRQGRTRRRGG